MKVLQKILFVDRDGTIIVEPPTDFQVDSLEKLEFLPKAISNLRRIAEELDYELVMVTNQDGLGTPSFPEETFHPAHNKMLTILKNEGVEFAEILIDRSFPHENKPTRKPGTAMLTRYIAGNGAEYDLANSFVIGDRPTDVQLAQNLGSRAIFLSPEASADSAEFTTTDWDEIYRFLRDKMLPARIATVHRITNETNIAITLNLDGTGKAQIHTGLGFFDHMLEQVARHSGCDLTIRVNGDLHIDEHHTIEDTALTLGEAFVKALGDKRGVERYGYFLLPMDEALAEAELWLTTENTEIYAAIDFSGRNWLVWKAEFKREKIGEMPTEMFFHFFKSFTDTAKCTLNIRAEADNEHHKIESIFKAFARALKMAVRRDANNNVIPSTKGVL